MINFALTLSLLYGLSLDGDYDNPEIGGGFEIGQQLGQAFGAKWNVNFTHFSTSNNGFTRDQYRDNNILYFKSTWEFF